MSFTTIQIRRGTAAAWSSANPVLAAGEMGFETDTIKIKFGDGSTAYNSLAYFSGSGLSSTLTSAHIFVGNGSNVATDVAVSGDLTATNAGAFTVAKIQGTSVSTPTGTGAVVLATSPTLVTPALGTPGSGVLTNCTGLTVPGGGSGRASTTAYAVICGGTTSTSAEQSIASVGTSGQVLTSNGAGALPTFQTASASGSSTSKAITQASHGFAVADVLYLNGTTYTKAKADSPTTADVVGIVSAVAGANDFTLTTEGYVSGLSGLTAGTTYFLSAATAGLLTATETTTAGQVSKPVLIADTTTSGYFFNFRGMTIATPSTGQVVLLSTLTASASATLDFTSVMTTAYDYYFLIFKDLQNSTTGTVQMTISTDNGSSWDADTIRTQVETLTMGGSTAPTYTGAAATTVAITESVSTAFDGKMEIYVPAAPGAGRVNGTSLLSHNGALNYRTTWTINTSGTAINAWRFKPSAGTFTSGTIQMYGVKNT